jgi:hypothetical protein
MSTLLDRARRGENLADLDIVDMHGHFGHYAMPIADMTPEGLVRVMDRVGVSALLVSHMQCTAMHVQLGNDEVLAAMRVCPGRILGYVVIFPSSLEDATAEMQRCADAGFTALKLHNSNGFAYTDPRYAGALSIANERRMPVLLHTWGEERDVVAVRDLAPKYPDAAFLLAHSGAGAAGTGFVALTNEFPNVYLELAYSAGPRGLVEKLVAQAGADRVVWGSDCYFFSMTQQIGKVLGADLSDEDKRKILSGNARRLLARVAV